MIVPYITAVSREVLLAVPGSQREAALGWRDAMGGDSTSPGWPNAPSAWSGKASMPSSRATRRWPVKSVARTRKSTRSRSRSFARCSPSSWKRRATPRAVRLILVSRFLERVADHVTNIAEMVVYMVEGKMVRHTLA